MVEIQQEPVDTPAQGGGGDDAKYRLIYAKSKVYINPTVYARDNIPGFVAIVKRVRMSSFLFELYSSLSNT
jgi:TBC1 domain family member 15